MIISVQHSSSELYTRNSSKSMEETVQDANFNCQPFINISFCSIPPSSDWMKFLNEQFITIQQSMNMRG